MKKLKVNASKEYDIVISDFSDKFSENAFLWQKANRIAVITDTNVDRIYENKFSEILCGHDYIKYVLQAGEKSKSGINYLKIINWLAESGFQRHDTVAAVGGGVVGDIAGFVASTYMRGIRLVSVPTTLLSMVDSSVGGKTAIDLPSGKNLCGTFYQPSAVIINTGFLSTLPGEELMNGYGEIIKYALLDKRVSAEMLEKGDYEDLIYNSLCIKRDIVEEDEYEAGKRALLNLGHTVGHAVEKLSGYTLPHGTCVVKGLKAALDVSSRLFHMDERTYSKILTVIKCKGHDISLVYPEDDIVKCIFSDKKSDGDSVRFVAVKDVAEPETVRLKINELKSLIKDNEPEIMSHKGR